MTGPSDADPPRTLGKYQLIRPIARGGMGEVHLARLPGELGFEKLLVVKTIRADLADDARFVELFAAEAKTAVALSHPNITPIYELGRADDGTLYTAMGWVDGPSLDRLLDAVRRRGRTLEPGAALYIVRELLDGLAHAHSDEHGRPPLVHRDVTPRNVLVDRSGRVQLVDFGIAKPAAEEVRQQMGSTGFMAPEQARGDAVDPRADVFSVGCVLYELLTLERAFPKAGVWTEPTLGDVHAAIRPVLARAIALEPGHRFADAAGFLRALAPLLAELAPSFGTQDLAALLRAFEPDEGWDQTASQTLDETGETPATRVPTGPPETFATRVPVEPAPSGSRGSVAGLAEVAEADQADEAGRARVWWLPAVLVALALVLAWQFRPRHSGRVDSSAAADAVPQPQPSPDPARPPAPEASADAHAPESSDDAPLDPDGALGQDHAGRSIQLRVRPEDAEVLADGRALDGPPFVLAGEGSVDLEVRKSGYRSHTTTIDLDASVEPDAVSITLEPLATGQLTVLAPDVAWADVLVDGESVGSTPLKAHTLLEGKHRIVVRCQPAVCGEARTLGKRTVTIQAGRTRSLVIRQ